jgi:quercetin dioxygenase-like cupin family protein
MRALALALVVACGAPAAPPVNAPPPPVEAPRAAPRGGGDEPASPDPGGREGPPPDDRLAAIQKAMNDLAPGVQACWAVVATERFDIEGELALQIEIQPGRATATPVRDTTRNAKLVACVELLVGRYPFAPPLHGQTIQLPFRFRAPDGQNTIDRALVPWHGQGAVSVAVLLDEHNSGNPAASMVELAVAAGGSTGLRVAERTELWYFLAAGQVTWGGAAHPIAAGDMLYVPAGAARDVASAGGELRAMIVMVPGGPEGSARAGALPTRAATAADRPKRPPVILAAAAARTYGPAQIFGDAASLHDPALAASILSLPRGGQVPEHVHAQESELLYLLAGSGTMTVDGVALPVGPTSVVQIPKGAKHGFTAAADVRAVQIYTPAGPEQRFKARPR